MSPSVLWYLRSNWRTKHSNRDFHCSQERELVINSSYCFEQLKSVQYYGVYPNTTVTLRANSVTKEINIYLRHVRISLLSETFSVCLSVSWTRYVETEFIQNSNIDNLPFGFTISAGKRKLLARCCFGS